MESLHGRVAIVTGAARGIGLGIAGVLRAEGADVLLADIDGDAAEAAAAGLTGEGGRALGVQADVTAEQDMQRLAGEAVQRWGRIDILAANAGIYPHIPLRELTVASFDTIVAINVRGALLAIQACLPQMSEQRYGRIVLTSSITGSIVGQPGYAHYGATKAAMLGLMRSAALEVAEAGITINAVLPGNIATPGFDELGPEHTRRMLAAIPLGRFGEPADVGWAVRALAARESGYITGQTLVVDGGQVLPESGE
jgi:3-oxoacyl-[acyl-carrier protein] reductase